jgi:CRISPR-associated exonuclease Cas4
MITATHINYYFICKRKLWLFSNGIQMEHTSELVAQGKQIGEYSYNQRPDKYTELELEGGKIDFYDAKNKIVHEVKKSNAKEDAHIAQVKFYLHLLYQNNIIGATGILEYPKLRVTEKVEYNNDIDGPIIETWVQSIKEIISKDLCPPKLSKNKCKNCSYYEFCWIEEDA